MHHPAITHIDIPAPVQLANRWKIALIAFSLIGVIAFVAGVTRDPARAWSNYLINYFMFLCFSMAGLFFVVIHHAVGAKWMIAVRRVAEGLTSFLPVALVLFVPLGLFGVRHLYGWQTGGSSAEPLKYLYLSVPLFNLRQYIFLLIWIFFAWKLVSLSLKQDQTADVSLRKKMTLWSIVFLPLFAGTFTLTSFDLIMSLEHRWYSTMFGVYCFAGLFQSGLALITILFIRLKQQGALAAVATKSHLKDLGTFVFAFTIFMTYIGFSQYMLIWYANLPEETYYFIERSSGDWQYLFLMLPLFKFAIPFFGLLSQAAKKSERWLSTICIAVIIGQYLDIYLLVMPVHNSSLVPIGWMEIGIFLGFVGLFGLAVSRFFSRYPALAARDPRILASANWRFWE